MSAERLQKVLASAGVASRRDCEELISGGRVTVNGQVMTELGARVDPEKDEIAVDGKPIGQPEERTYLMLNKPVGVVATADDPQGRPTVVELVEHAARLFPVGRLDTDSEGLLLMTDDGELTHRLTHPSFEVEKEYRVLLDRMPSPDALRQWREGVMLEGERTAPAWVEVLESSDNGVWVRVVLREGRKRQIREVAKLLGYEVLRLIRVREDTLTLGDLQSGQARPLTAPEIAALKAHTVVAAPRATGNRAARNTRQSDETSDEERQLQESASSERAPRARTPYGRGDENDRPRGGDRDEGGFRDRREGGRRDEGGFRGRRDNERSADRDDRGNERGYDPGVRRNAGGFRGGRDDRAAGGRDFGSRRDEGGYRDRRDDRAAGGRDFGSRRDEGSYRDRSGPPRGEGGYRDRSGPSRDYGSGPRRDERDFGGRRDEGGYRGERRDYGNDRREAGPRRDEGGYRERSSGPRDFTNRRDDRVPGNRDYGNRRDEGSYRDRSGPPSGRDFNNRRDERPSSNRDYSRRDTGSSYRDRRDDRAPGGQDSAPRRDEGGYRDRSAPSRDSGPRRDAGSGYRERGDFGSDRRDSGPRRDTGGYRDRRDERPSGDRPYNNRRDTGGQRDFRSDPRRDDRQGNGRPDYRRDDRRDNNGGDRPPRAESASPRRTDAQPFDENRRPPRPAQQEPAPGPGRAWRERQEEEAQQRKARVAGGARVARGNFRSRIAGRPAFPVRSRPRRSDEGESGEGE